jgi:hypothetical protein
MHIRYRKGDKDLDSGDQSKRNVELGDHHANLAIMLRNQPSPILASSGAQ